MDNIGARWSFRLGSAIALVTFCFYAIVQRFMPPVKFITHDDQKDPEVKEPLKGEHEEIIKAWVESEIEAEQLKNEVEKVDETTNQEFVKNSDTRPRVGNDDISNDLKD